MSGCSVSVIVPAYNEGTPLAATLDLLVNGLAALRNRYQCELLVIDDGSTDETSEILAAFARAQSDWARVVTHSTNRGLTAAIETGARAARGRTVVYLDADLSYAPPIVERLVAAREKTAAAAVLASPYMRGGRVGNVPLERLVASRAANLMLAACVGFRLHTFTGMVRAYHTGTFLEILERPVRGEFNAWVVAQLLRERKRVIEIPAALVWPTERTEAPSRISWASLRKRTRLVIQTIGALREATRNEAPSAFEPPTATGEAADHRSKPRANGAH